MNKTKTPNIHKKNINIIYNSKLNLLINFNLNLNIYSWVVNVQNVTNPKKSYFGRSKSVLEVRIGSKFVKFHFILYYTVLLLIFESCVSSPYGVFIDFVG